MIIMACRVPNANPAKDRRFSHEINNVPFDLAASRAERCRSSEQTSVALVKSLHAVTPINAVQCRAGAVGAGCDAGSVGGDGRFRRAAAGTVRLCRAASPGREAAAWTAGAGAAGARQPANHWILHGHGE